MKTRAFRRRGAAAVEMAVTMIVLVPLILYTLFLEDLLAYRLENQEPTIVAGWDYITNNYMKGDGIKDIGRLNRLKYCDHTAAYDSYEANYDCQGVGVGPEGAGGDDGSSSQDYDSAGGGSSHGSGHHTASAAHQCWIVSGAQQVRCSLSKSAGITAMSGSASQLYHMSGWNRGGMATCTAQLAVMNYMLPNKVWGLMGMSEGDKSISGGKGRNNAGAGENATFTDIDAKTTDANVHADKTNTANAWILRKESFAVMADPWALNLIDEKVEPSTGSPITSFLKPGMIPGMDIHHPLLDRSGHYYNSYFRDAVSSSDSYFDSMTDYLNDSIMFGAKHDGIGPLGGDNPASLPVYWDKPVQRSNNSGYASGWKDDRQSTASNGRSEYPW